jgi:hypothetical protein
MGPNGSCRYFIAIFFAVIYAGFAISYLVFCLPNLPHLYPESYHFHILISVFILPWPWVVVFKLHFMDPGWITAENVESYLQVYPYDRVLYNRHICHTQRIPVPARSRFCQYTRKRVAYFFDC